MIVDGQLNIFEHLSQQIDEKLDAVEPEWWGEQTQLAEHERFYGRYLGMPISPVTEREVVLLLARTSSEGWDGPVTFMRGTTVLLSQLRDTRPNEGDYIVIHRKEDREGKDNTYHDYVVVPSPCPHPLPPHAQPPVEEKESAQNRDGVPYA